MSAIDKIRLILDSPHSAVFNMAADEMLLERQGDPASLPTLRIYFWDSPAVSVGYFQDVQAAARRFKSENRPYPIVRRITGGGLVLHGDDLTFSLVLKNDGRFLPADVKESYRKVNQALRAGLGGLYPGLDYADCNMAPSGRGSDQRVCFEQPSCYDLLIGKKKVIGASQRRKENAILHHCAVFLKQPKELLIESILKGFRESWKVDFQELPFSASETELIRQKEIQRRMSPEWGTMLS